MDETIEQKKKEKENKLRLEMMRKARQDVEAENRLNYEKKVEELNKKDKEKEKEASMAGGDWFDSIKAVDTDL